MSSSREAWCEAARAARNTVNIRCGCSHAVASNTQCIYVQKLFNKSSTARLVRRDHARSARSAWSSDRDSG